MSDFYVELLLVENKKSCMCACHNHFFFVVVLETNGNSLLLMNFISICSICAVYFQMVKGLESHTY